MRLGAIEAGGTKMICAICDENGNIYERMSTPTLTPAETLPAMHKFFEDHEIDCLGIACFGPLDLKKDSPTYGHITTTPKLAWQNCDIVGYFSDLGVPVGFDTDVNGSVTGEATFGIARGIKNVVYFTIGTGVGAGILCEGNLVHGMLHPEGGHVLLTKHPDDPMEGSNCPFHPNCFEGLCAGPALQKRWGVPGKDLTERDDVWDMEAWYIAQALVSYTMILSPEIFILGGGVSHQKKIFPLVRKYYAQFMNGYLKTKQLEDLDSYIVCQSLDDNQGLLGAAIIGKNALEEK